VSSCALVDLILEGTEAVAPLLGGGSPSGSPGPTAFSLWLVFCHLAGDGTVGGDGGAGGVRAWTADRGAV